MVREKKRQFGCGRSVTGCKPGVDACRIGLERFAGFGRQGREARTRCTVEIEQTQETVTLEGKGTQEFGDTALRPTALHLHLEEAVLGMRKAQSEIGVPGRLREDMGDAPFITQDFDIVPEAFDGHVAFDPGKGCPQPEEKGDGSRQNKNRKDEDDPEGFPYDPHVGDLSVRSSETIAFRCSSSLGTAPRVAGSAKAESLMGLPDILMCPASGSSAATIMCVVFGSLAAYTQVRRRFYGKWALDLTIMLPFIIPGIVTGVAFLTSFNTGLVVLTGTAMIIILAYFTRRIAYIFRSVSASIAQVDNKIEEASTICGATWGRTMRKVTVPLIAPGILAGSILVFSTLITEMSVTIILYSARWKTISISIFEQLTSDDVLEASTVGAIAIVMTLILVFTASKLIGKSMSDMFR